ncbi:MAG TPA: aminoglycoside phosphotransferase family protein [Capillimicrobium sp.]
MGDAVDARLRDLARRWAAFWPGADTEAMAFDVRARAQAAAGAWGLSELAPFARGDVALVAAAGDAVLKVSPRGHVDERGMLAEGTALEHWGPTGAVPRVRGRRDGGLTLLLERVAPGEPLDDSGLPLERRLDALGALARRLHGAGPPPAAVPHIGEDYAHGWRTALAGRPERDELEELLAPRADDALLHADLHGGNALSAGGGAWRAIDPHAVRGDRHADVWALIDPLVPALPQDAVEAASVARSRLERYAAAAGLDVDRAAAWTRLRARAEALATDARGADADPDDREWAARLHRTADALAPRRPREGSPST